MAEVQFCSDAGGNAEKFQGGDAEEALLRLKTLWSKAWKEQGRGPGCHPAKICKWCHQLSSTTSGVTSKNNAVCIH